MRQLNQPLVVQEGLRQEVVLGYVVAEGLEAAYFVEDWFAHETRHACHAVDAYQVDEQVHATVARAKVDFFQGACEAWTVGCEWHLVDQAYFVGHETYHVVQCVRCH